MPSYLDILAPNRIPDTRGVGRRTGPADLETCVRNDLHRLLNTRRPPDSMTADYPELATSIFNLGLKDFTFAEMVSTEDRLVLARHVAEVIAMFEPRLTEIRVTPSDPDEAEQQHGPDQVRRTVIYYRIAARLIGPAGETDAAFDNVFEWTTGHHEIAS